MTLSTPLLWVLFPMLIALITVVFYPRKQLGMILTSVTAFGLSLLALVFPENMTIALGPVVLFFEESLGILGREIIITLKMLHFIGLLFFFNGLWVLASGIKGVPVTFRPISLMIIALLTAAIGVKPFLYAALLIEAAILVSILMLTPLGKTPHPGVLRYITLQTLAMPFILLAGWLLTGVEALPPESPLILQSALFLGLGVALWLSIFPFHSWVPMVSQRSNPVVTSFLLFMFPTVILLFSLNFLNRYTFLRESAELYETLQIIGTLMIVAGGAWTAIQNNLKRSFGFATLTETGFSLLAVGLSAQGGLNWMLLLLPARAMGYWLWGYCLTLLEAHTDSLELQNLEGIARKFPILSLGLLLAQLSVAGLPLLATFPVKIALVSAAFESKPAIGAWTFIGSLGLFIFTIRLLVVLVQPDDADLAIEWSFTEKAKTYVPVLIVVMGLLVLGLIPHPFLSGILQTLSAFGQLQ